MFLIWYGIFLLLIFHVYKISIVCSFVGVCDLFQFHYFMMFEHVDFEFEYATLEG